MPSDAAKAVVWYRKAADQGDGEAATALGQLFENGKGIAENDVSAAEWYALSAKIGDPMGTFLYGRAFQCSIGLPQNHGEVMMWSWRAEARGHPECGRWGRWLRGEGNDIGACYQPFALPPSHSEEGPDRLRRRHGIGSFTLMTPPKSPSCAPSRG